MGCSTRVASSSAGSGSTVLQNSGSEEDLRVLIEQRKRKRMISNRESAGRSRMRKQNHLDDLAAHAAQLQAGNHRLASAIDMATRYYLAVKTQNSILKDQMDELCHRLRSLDEIIASCGINSDPSACPLTFDGFLMNP
ncbi:hypothetical protein MLD38_032066 [Melastoma candidum]|uniref:Uncharacterized protein n=1 Tax=Melastoma candidum TaxID=119954 RepID=A0ACB9M606_9MYRT|nr:hypothetical protein MLD38_032066 [Melastoma candidum]